MYSPTRHFSSILFGPVVGALALALTVGACGGSDSTTSSGGGDDDSSGSEQLLAAEVAPMSDSVKGLSGDESLDYTIDLPLGMEVSEFSTDINRKWENPDATIGDAEINASVLWTPVAYDAAGIIDGRSDIQGGDEVLDQGDDADLSFATFSNPGESGEIYSVGADTSRTLDDGTTLRCSAAINVAIGETWDDDKIASNAEAMLELCTSANASS